MGRLAVNENRISRLFVGLATRATLLSPYLLLVACSGLTGSSERLSAPEQVKISRLDVNMYPANKLVCDPMEGNEPDPRSNAGLKAELYYLNPGDAIAQKVSDVITRGKKANRDLFFQKLDVPTRMFDTGFINHLGEPVRDDQQNKLIENFALRFSSVVSLASDQEEGLYEFAVLSDDGAIFKMRNSQGVYEDVVQNDGVHPTQLGCSTNYQEFKRDTEKLMTLDYHQGPRHHISLMLLMRKVPADGKKDLACGQSGNDHWFDPQTQSPKQAYKDLLARGWRPLSQENFSLANSAVFNPCKDGIMPKIAEFTVSESFRDGFFVVWRTDIPATSQVIVTDLVTKEQIVTTSDNVLRTQHAVQVNGLKPGHDYAIQALSISDTYGKSMTTPIYTRTTN